ncbi:radical SAM protein [Neorhizobium galegae]|uniref:radical SAM protein n=1 Tax=Neorhizobium galegae TaxID=399 RepID=UPI00062189B9|nr:radical SAM protein [Neorhizobium galegae]KAB1122247.1 radical SAM protein [Neorhizobium galegae]MCQ1805808.1 radical SAM protein [Neorhizobium galegae]CDZ58105.1 Anaerobic sulfatase-maturating enzyme [Neorhizobium galegae bv. orientalis]
MSTELISRPINLVIAKIAQRCNLNCSYCYVYNRGDTSWQSRPKIMSDATARLLGERILENASAHNSPQVHVELHGGEPLLLGKRRFESLVTSMWAGARGADLTVFLQTNGTLLDREWIDLFRKLNISFGISLDGPAAIHDQYRLTFRNSGSHDRVMRAIKLAQESSYFEELFSGYLCVVDPTSDPNSIIDWFQRLNARTVDLLLPDRTLLDRVGVDGDVRLFLLSAFKKYVKDYNGRTRIRIFDRAIEATFARRDPLDAFGGSLRNMCVIESDGEIYPHDVLRITGYGRTKRKIYLEKYPIGIVADYFGVEALEDPAPECTGCKHFLSCGGGYLPHRFDGSSFRNPSFHCAALFGLFETADEFVREQLSGSEQRVNAAAANEAT